MKLTVNGKPAFAYTGTRDFNPTLPTAVFIHGAANDHSVWSLQSRYFAFHGWNVLALDLPGHGQSDGAPCTTIGDYANWVAAFMDTVGVRAAVVIGHSMGSLTALELASQRSDLVRKLALVGTAVPMAVGDALLDAARDDEDKARRMIIEWSFAPASQLGNNHAVPGMWLPGNGLALLRRMAKGVLHTDLSACKAYVGGIEAAKAVAVPALVVIGARDMMTSPKGAQGVIAALPDVRVETLTEAGHSMLSEAPGLVLGALWKFANA
ncbi:MAG: alpha/beta hydrolase, partial [Casimicrobium sp.]